MSGLVLDVKAEDVRFGELWPILGGLRVWRRWRLLASGFGTGTLDWVAR